MTDFASTKNRSAYTIGLRIVRDAAVPIVPTQLDGTTGDEWAVGAVLTETEGHKAASLPTTIDANISGPVRFLALTAFAGGATEDASGIRIQRSTRIIGQISTGTAVKGDIGKQGRLIQDATTGLYAVNLGATAAPSIEVTSAEPLDFPWEPGANGTYNLVEFKFLDTVLDIAPATAS